ncbi:MAG: phosphatase [Negativicutes bacterium]|nr:phosphatase [Negativicutes bacterium]
MRGKLWLIAVVAAVLAFLPPAAVGGSKYGEHGDQSVLITDVDPGQADVMPADFRSCRQLPAAPDGTTVNTTGLYRLNISGSGQFSGQQLPRLIEEIRKQAGQETPVYIVDLRQEWHGFIDGLPVSWYGVNDWANRQLTCQQVIEGEQQRLADLSVADQVVLTLAKGRQMTVNQPFTVLSEQQLVAGQGVNYQRLTATDHIKPNDEAVDMFVQFVQRLPKDCWLHFHCHAGHGRTTTFMVMYDIIRNHRQVALDDIVARQHLIGGIDLYYTGHDSGKEDWEGERSEFIHQFFRYVEENSASSFAVPWSVWSRSRYGRTADGQ